MHANDSKLISESEVEKDIGLQKGLNKLVYQWGEIQGYALLQGES